jgi:hypothetical protein
MDTHDIEETLREFALAFNGEENDGTIPQGFANRLTSLANDMRRHREFCEGALHPDNASGLAGAPDQLIKLKMAVEGGKGNK